MKKLKLKDLQIGMKVVPHSKSVDGWGGLSESVVWDKAQRDQQPFLYVTQIGPNQHDPNIEELIALDWRNDPNSGDYFVVSDITLYKPSYVCIKAFPGCDVGTEFHTYENEELYQNEEYFKVIFPKPTPELTMEGYKLRIDSEAKTLRWGCREFTFDEFKTIFEAFDVLYAKDLYMGVGRDERLDAIRYIDMKNIFDYITNIK
jgi:hypothetical protein